MSEILRCLSIQKNFGGVRALRGVDFTLKKGGALALIGENGAGKSTLMKIISGVYAHDSFSGSIEVEGLERHFYSTSDAENAGIAIIHQELNLFKDLSISENIFLSSFTKKKGLIDYNKMNLESSKLLSMLGMNYDPATRLGDLTTGHQQLVEIAKAISKNCRVLILDEPTSSLTKTEIENLFQVLRGLREKGLSYIYISHKLDEVYALCDEVTVLRDGESVYKGELKNLSEKEIIKHMVGRELQELYPAIKKRQEGRHEEREESPFFEIKNWSAFKKSEAKFRVKDFSFKAYKGEILGISGLMGAGRTDLLLSIFGFSNYETTGEIVLEGKSVKFSGPEDAINAGIGLVSEDRKKNGLHLNFSILDNMSMASISSCKEKGLLSTRLQTKLGEELVKKLFIKIPSLSHPVKSLSGGNQQKVAIAKWLSINPRVLFLDEPTRGIDVGAKFEIYSLLGKLVDEGVCVIVASSELPELMGLCHRIIVMKEGRKSGEFEGNERRETAIISAAIGASAV